MDDWYQQVLTPPDVIEVRIRLGLVPETDHAQVMVEMFDPVTNILKAQASIPHDRLTSWARLMDWAAQKADEWLQQELEPF